MSGETQRPEKADEDKKEEKDKGKESYRRALLDKIAKRATKKHMKK